MKTLQANKSFTERSHLLLREGNDTIFQRGHTGRDGASAVCSSKEFALQTNLRKLAASTNDMLSKQTELCECKDQTGGWGGWGGGERA